MCASPSATPTAWSVRPRSRSPWPRGRRRSRSRRCARSMSLPTETTAGPAPRPARRCARSRRRPTCPRRATWSSSPPASTARRVAVPRSGTAAQPIVFRGSAPAPCSTAARRRWRRGPPGAAGRRRVRAGSRLRHRARGLGSGPPLPLRLAGRAAALAAGAPGGFFFDGTTLSVKMANGSSPAAHTMHVARREDGFVLDGRANVRWRTWRSATSAPATSGRASTCATARTARCAAAASTTWARPASGSRAATATWWRTASSPTPPSSTGPGTRRRAAAPRTTAWCSPTTWARARGAAQPVPRHLQRHRPLRVVAAAQRVQQRDGRLRQHLPPAHRRRAGARGLLRQRAHVEQPHPGRAHGLRGGAGRARPDLDRAQRGLALRQHPHQPDRRLHGQRAQDQQRLRHAHRPAAPLPQHLPDRRAGHGGPGPPQPRDSARSSGPATTSSPAPAT